VLWVEPNPAVLPQLERTIARFRGQRAIRALCSNRTGETVVFNVASNQGQSSSILSLGRHAEIYSSIRYTASFEMTTTTVDELITQQDLEPQSFDWLTVDTQVPSRTWLELGVARSPATSGYRVRRQGQLAGR